MLTSCFNTNRIDLKFVLIFIDKRIFVYVYFFIKRKSFIQQTSLSFINEN